MENILANKPIKPELAKHDATILDLAFVMDCTGSMGSYIQNATQSIRKIVEEIVSLEKSDIKLALVEYRDHPPQDTTFVVRVHDFTESVKEMKGWLEQCKAQGGGDGPEAVADGLQAALKLNWREKSTKICVLIADAPPHGLCVFGSDGFPNGCPDGIDPVIVVEQMAQKGITLYSVGCEPAILRYKDIFTAFAFKTGGQYVPLRNANHLAKVIVGSAAEEISLEKLLGEAEEEIKLQKQNGVFDVASLTNAVQNRLASKGTTTNQIMLNNSNIQKNSSTSYFYSGSKNMAHLQQQQQMTSSKIMLQQQQQQPQTMQIMNQPHILQTQKIMPQQQQQQQQQLPLMQPQPLSIAISTSSFSSITDTNVDTYDIEKRKITEEQSERLVQKILKRTTE